MTSAIRFVIGVALAVLLSALFPVDVYAQKVALLHADTATRAETVRTKLNAAGVTDVTVINVGTGPAPTISDLEMFQAVLVWSNSPYLQSAGLGDALADYVDQGGGVVEGVFSFDPGTSLGGRWNSEQYSVFTVSANLLEFDLVFTPTQPAHPILNGVAFTPSPMNFFNPSGLQGDSVAIADWNNPVTGEVFPAVATRPGPYGGKIVGLNFHPALGDAGALMVSALRFVAGEAAVPVDGPSVALLAAGGASAGVGDVRSKLKSLRLFSRIDTFDVSSPVAPTLDTLMRYDAVMTWSSANYGNPAGLGNVLADYVDQNRGVVQSVFGYDPAAGVHLEGRWATGGYRPLTEGLTSPLPAAPLTLLPVLPGHAMLSGVASFNGGASSYHSMSALEAATTLVANWSDGLPLVAFGTKPAGGRVVGLNMYPPSSDRRADLWDSTTDGARLMANALMLAANHFPAVDDVPDQIGAATSPAGVSFTLNATASDLDGDALSYNWSGAVTATGQSIVVDVPPPPAGHQSHSLTVTLTVADGKGGETTDSVELTVTDLVAPVLHNMPSGVITAEATSDSGATVTYGPVTATDAVDGDVPVTCSHSGVFPVGDTVVTCSASDSRTNTTSQSFTVRVTRVVDPEPPAPEPTPGKAYGNGFIRQDNKQSELAFTVLENSAGDEWGTLLLTVKSAGSTGYQGRDYFVSTMVTSLIFGADCNVRFTGTGHWNGQAGYRYVVSAVDKHNTADLVRITITSPSGEVVAQVGGKLDGGNVTVFHKTF